LGVTNNQSSTHRKEAATCRFSIQKVMEVRGCWDLIVKIRHIFLASYGKTTNEIAQMALNAFVRKFLRPAAVTQGSFFIVFFAL